MRRATIFSLSLFISLASNIQHGVSTWIYVINIDHKPFSSRFHSLAAFTKSIIIIQLNVSRILSNWALVQMVWCVIRTLITTWTPHLSQIFYHLAIACVDETHITSCVCIAIHENRICLREMYQMRIKVFRNL